VAFFAIWPASPTVKEARGSAHQWTRVLTQLGHDAQFIVAHFVRLFVKSNKVDAAIWEAAQRPGMRLTPIKTKG